MLSDEEPRVAGCGGEGRRGSMPVLILGLDGKGDETPGLRACCQSRTVQCLTHLRLGHLWRGLPDVLGVTISQCVDKSCRIWEMTVQPGAIGCNAVAGTVPMTCGYAVLLEGDVGAV